MNLYLKNIAIKNKEFFFKESLVMESTEETVKNHLVFCLPPMGGDERMVYHIEKYFEDNFSDKDMIFKHTKIN